MFEMAMVLAVCIFVTLFGVVFMAVPFAGIAYSFFMYREGEWEMGQLIGGVIGSALIGSIFFLIGFSFLGVWTVL